MPIEERAADPGPVHDLADVELGVGAVADELLGRLDDSLPAALARLPAFERGVAVSPDAIVDIV